jgi:hypothetical protein
MIRGVVNILILIVAWLGASAAAAATSAALGIFFRSPSPALATIVATLVGLSIYCVGSSLARFLPRRTGDQHGLFQMISGMGGACCGLLFGLFFLWGGISLVRSLGLVGEMRLLAAAHQGRSIKEESLAYHLIRLERSLEMGPVGAFLVSTDPLSPAFYQNTRKSMMVVQDPELFECFLHSPNVERLLQHESLHRIVTHHEELQERLKRGELTTFLHDLDVQALLHDEQFKEEIKQFDLSQALDYALKRSYRDLPVNIDSH